jgi:hypothetical protein
LRIRYNPVGSFYTVPLHSSSSRPRTSGYHRLLWPSASNHRRGCVRDWVPRQWKIRWCSPTSHPGRMRRLGCSSCCSPCHQRVPGSSAGTHSTLAVVMRQDVRGLAVAVRLPGERDLLQGTRTGPGGDSSCHWCLLVARSGQAYPMASPPVIPRRSLLPVEGSTRFLAVPCSPAGCLARCSRSPPRTSSAPLCAPHRASCPWRVPPATSQP